MRSSYGFGFGSGCGYGDEEKKIGEVGRYVIVDLSPWPYIRVGCEVHSRDHWLRNWMNIASRSTVDIEEARAALQKINLK